MFREQGNFGRLRFVGEACWNQSAVGREGDAGGGEFDSCEVQHDKKLA